MGSCLFNLMAKIEKTIIEEIIDIKDALEGGGNAHFIESSANIGGRNIVNTVGTVKKSIEDGFESTYFNLTSTDDSNDPVVHDFVFYDENDGYGKMFYADALGHGGIYTEQKGIRNHALFFDMPPDWEAWGPFDLKMLQTPDAGVGSMMLYADVTDTSTSTKIGSIELVGLGDLVNEKYYLSFSSNEQGGDRTTSGNFAVYGESTELDIDTSSEDGESYARIYGRISPPEEPGVFDSAELTLSTRTKDSLGVEWRYCLISLREKIRLDGDIEFYGASLKAAEYSSIYQKIWTNVVNDGGISTDARGTILVMKQDGEIEGARPPAHNVVSVEPEPFLNVDEIDVKLPGNTVHYITTEFDNINNDPSINNHDRRIMGNGTIKVKPLTTGLTAVDIPIETIASGRTGISVAYGTANAINEALTMTTTCFVKEFEDGSGNKVLRVYFDAVDLGFHEINYSFTATFQRLI